MVYADTHMQNLCINVNKSLSHTDAKVAILLLARPAARYDRSLQELMCMHVCHSCGIYILTHCIAACTYEIRNHTVQPVSANYSSCLASGAPA